MRKIYATNEAGKAVEIVPLSTCSDFLAARESAARAADEIRANGLDAQPDLVYESIAFTVSRFLDLKGYMSTRTSLALFHETLPGELLKVLRYMSRCIERGDRIYWQYVYNTLLDFLEAEHFTKGYKNEFYKTRS